MPHDARSTKGMARHRCTCPYRDLSSGAERDFNGFRFGLGIREPAEAKGEPAVIFLQLGSACPKQENLRPNTGMNLTSRRGPGVS
jgi:hypothetical protein